MKYVVELCLGVVLLLPALARAQAESQDPDPQVLTVDVELVDVLFTVTDRDNRLLTGLSEEDVQVFEDGVLQQIRSFEARTDLPLTLGLAVDVSGSIREKLPFEQEAAIEFFHSTLQPGLDQGMLLTFDSRVDVLQEFTDNAGELSDSLRDIQAGGGTALYDAIFLAIEQRISRQPEGRRVLVLISDGADNASRVSMEETLEMAQKNDVAIYAVSTNQTASFGTSDEEDGDETLEVFAQETGGRAFFPRKLEDLLSSFQEISDELRSQYALTYRSTNTGRDGSFREIEVRTRDDDYGVQARSGYYAPVEGQADGQERGDDDED